MRLSDHKCMHCHLKDVTSRSLHVSTIYLFIATQFDSYNSRAFVFDVYSKLLYKLPQP